MRAPFLPLSQGAEACEGYGSRAFWDARYEDSAATLFDWYQDYEALAQLLLVRAARGGAGALRSPQP